MNDCIETNKDTIDKALQTFAESGHVRGPLVIETRNSNLNADAATLYTNVLTANPTAGNTPLSVTFTTKELGFDGWLDFGDGQSAQYSFNACSDTVGLKPEIIATACDNPKNTIDHTYKSPGTYTAILSKISSYTNIVPTDRQC
jgi:PKD repeat protein